MQQTTNYGFNKPEYTDALNINVINGVMDKIDDTLFGLTESMAIVQETNIATKDISSGMYVYWNSGMHIANADIAEGDTLSSDNLDDVDTTLLDTGHSIAGWKRGYIQVPIDIASGSTYSTNLYSAIQNFLDRNNALFGFLLGWSIYDGYDVVVQNFEYVDSSSSLRVRNVGSKKIEGDALTVGFIYALRG